MIRVVTVILLFMSMATAAAAQTVVQPILRTAPLFNYEDAPATPDADDPAIWINTRNQQQSLVIGTAKDAGLLVYDLSGKLLGLLVVQNGEAPEPPSTDPINGFEFDGSTQFLYIDFRDALKALVE